MGGARRVCAALIGVTLLQLAGACGPDDDAGGGTSGGSGGASTGGSAGGGTAGSGAAGSSGAAGNDASQGGSAGNDASSGGYAGRGGLACGRGDPFEDDRLASAFEVERDMGILFDVARVTRLGTAVVIEFIVNEYAPARDDVRSPALRVRRRGADGAKPIVFGFGQLRGRFPISTSSAASSPKSRSSSPA